MGLSTGARLGVYEIISLLGAGGMGEVYRARDTRTGAKPALTTETRLVIRYFLFVSLFC